MPAHRDAPVGDIDVGDRGFANADVDQRDNLLDFGEQGGGERGRGESQAAPRKNMRDGIIRQDPELKR